MTETFKLLLKCKPFSVNKSLNGLGSVMPPDVSKMQSNDSLHLQKFKADIYLLSIYIYH